MASTDTFFDGEYLNKIPEINRRCTLRQNLEYIQKPHKSVEPGRPETQFTFYPIKRNPRLGFFVSYIHGHDNYNFRFVDSGNQVAVGVSWDQFPPMQLSSDLD